MFRQPHVSYNASDAIYPDRYGNDNPSAEIASIKQMLAQLMARDLARERDMQERQRAMEAREAQLKAEYAALEAKVVELSQGPGGQQPSTPSSARKGGPRNRYAGPARSLSHLLEAERSERSANIEAGIVVPPRKNPRGSGKKTARDSSAHTALPPVREEHRRGRRVETPQPPAAAAAKRQSKPTRFNESLLPRPERMILVDAIQSTILQAKERGGRAVTYAEAFREVLKRIGAKDSQYISKFKSVLDMNPKQLRSLIAYWCTGWLRLQRLRNVSIMLAFENNRRTDESGAEALIAAKLKSLARRQLLWSVDVALAHIKNSDEWSKLTRLRAAQPGVLPPTICRTRVYLAMKAAKLRFQVPATSLPQDFEEQKTRLLVEILYLTSKYNIPPTQIFNIDETCLRMFPKAVKTWCLQGGMRSAGVQATKAFTTVLVGCSLAGASLKPMVNWRGTTSRCLAYDGNVPHEVGEKVRQYNQWTYWSTTESLLTYVREEILPHHRSVRRNASEKFILLLDHAPVHNSFETRKAFYDEFGGKGFLVFIPRGCTSKLQPMDQRDRFGAFKQAVKKRQTEEAVSGTYQHASLIWNLKMVKEMVMKAIAHGQSVLLKPKAGVAAAAAKQRPAPLAWDAIRPYNSDAMKLKLFEWTKASAETRWAVDMATSDAYKLFEYGYPDKEVLERSKFYERRRAGGNAWEDIVDGEDEPDDTIDGDQDINDVPEFDGRFSVDDVSDGTDLEADSEGFTAADLDEYLMNVSDNEEDDDRSSLPAM